MGRMTSHILWKIPKMSETINQTYIAYIPHPSGIFHGIFPWKILNHQRGLLALAIGGGCVHVVTLFARKLARGETITRKTTG